jgi:hypothetical protein
MNERAHQLFCTLRQTPQFTLNSVFFSQAFAAFGRPSMH